MPYHVDIVENDWTRGVQRVVARVLVNGSLIVQAPLPERDEWERRLFVPRFDQFGAEISRTDNPKDYLRHLAEDLEAGSYVFALRPHEDEECGLAVGQDLPMAEREPPPPQLVIDLSKH